LAATQEIPYLEFALDFARKNTNRLLHSYGAIQCLEKLLGLVEDDGFILINDYGQAEIKPDDDFEHQRFSLATFVGVNFPLLQAYFERSEKYRWCEPTSDDSGLHSRLLSAKAADATVARFTERFGKAALEHIQEPVQCARAS